MATGGQAGCVPGDSTLCTGHNDAAVALSPSHQNLVRHVAHSTESGLWWYFCEHEPYLRDQFCVHLLGPICAAPAKNIGRGRGALAPRYAEQIACAMNDCSDAS